MTGVVAAKGNKMGGKAAHFIPLFLNTIVIPKEARLRNLLLFNEIAENFELRTLNC